jgi:hypothetical protein
VFGRWRNRDDYADLARALRRERPQPPLPLVESITAGIAAAERPALRRSRTGLALALTFLAVVAVVSFGGVGYARSLASDALKKVEKPAVRQGPRAASSAQAPTSAQAQYGAFTPPSTTPATGGSTQPGQQVTPSNTSGKGKGKGKGVTGQTAGGVAGKTFESQTNGGQGAAGQTVSGQGGSSLPFTGLALWIPMLLGAFLIGAGLLLRSRGRKADPTA